MCNCACVCVLCRCYSNSNVATPAYMHANESVRHFFSVLGQDSMIQDGTTVMVSLSHVDTEEILRTSLQEKMSNSLADKGVLQCVAVCCSVLQCVAVCCSVF